MVNYDTITKLFWLAMKVDPKMIVIDQVYKIDSSLGQFGLPIIITYEMNSKYLWDINYIHYTFEDLLKAIFNMIDSWNSFKVIKNQFSF